MRKIKYLLTFALLGGLGYSVLGGVRVPQPGPVRPSGFTWGNVALDHGVL